MRLTRIGLGEGEISKCRLDLIVLREDPLPVELFTWGKIKALWAE